ncbi:hypothetical protein BKA65DRAFT_582327 [Rhexocercosporidium sp. MPI-PUGE-AT-0058]|nr:hypothetical protein BKA65DRAFT_582327 [Rhexocercosporidium sp. MPI-PUGE-AT-0058]
MAHINILKYGVSSPADTSPLGELKVAGYQSSDILAVIGKSEGRERVRQRFFSRTLSTHVWERAIPVSAVTIFSGGTEGVLSPHVTFIVREPTPTGLVAVVGRTRELQPHEIGTTEHAVEVGSSVTAMLGQSGISKEQVHLVLIKCPLLTSAKVEAILAASKTPVTMDTYESMAKSRYASAVGIAVALDEIKVSGLDEAMQNEDCWSSKASCSSGAELEGCHIIILASNTLPGNLRAASAFMEDGIDAGTLIKVLDEIRNEHGHVVQVFAKAESDPRGKIRGKRHTMNTDSDIHSTRHARAAVGGLIAGLVGDTHVYVSGGAEGQGPLGGGMFSYCTTLIFIVFILSPLLLQLRTSDAVHLSHNGLRKIILSRLASFWDLYKKEGLSVHRWSGPGTPAFSDCQFCLRAKVSFPCLMYDAANGSDLIMKATIVLLPALMALCHAAALPQDADIVEREQGRNLWERQITKYTTLYLPTPVVTKTSTITKPYTKSISTVVITVTGKPTTITPPPVTVTVTAKTSAKPPVTITVTVTPPEETEEPEEPENPWQITRTLPPLTFGKRDPSPAPAPEPEPQRGNRPTRWGNWGPGGQTIVQTQTVKETVTYYPPTSMRTSVTTVYYTPPASMTKAPSIITSTTTVIPSITIGPITTTKTLTPTPTPKSTVKSTLTIWDKRSPQSLGLPSRTTGTLPTKTEYPDPEEDPEEYPEYPEEETTYVLGTPTRTVNVSPTPMKPTTTKKPASSKPTTYLAPSPTNEFSIGQPLRTVNISPTSVATTSKKPWWYSPPKTVTVYLPPKPSPTGTLIRNSGTMPVLTLGGKRASARGKRQAADADVTRSATFAPGAPVKSVPGFVTSTTKP